MADPGTDVTKTSKYLYPGVPPPDTLPRSKETAEKTDEEPKENPTTTVEINDDTGYENRNKEGGGDVPENEEKEDELEQKDTEKPLLEEKQTVLDIRPDSEGEDTPTLPISDKKKKSIESLDVSEKGGEESKLPKYLFPITRIKESWNNSTNVFQFLGDVVCIIFQTVGWFTCVGGIPFLSLVMLIIGSIYIDDCRIQPNIPIYLIVSGVIGTIQHFIVIWTRYVPKTSKGQLKIYRSYCRSINGLLHLFLLIWFILGAVWVYGAFSDVDTKDPEKEEYCNLTLYYFTFWVFNLSFILLGLICFLSLCFLVCVITTDK